MVNKLHEVGITSNMAYTAGMVSIGLSFASWATSKRGEDAGTDRADRWGIFVGMWAPTFLALGNGLALQEAHGEDVA